MRMHVPLVQAREIKGSYVHTSRKPWAVSLRIDPEPGTRPAATAVPAGSASCAGSEVDRKVGLDTELDGIQAALFNWGVSYITQRIEARHYY